jgi:PAS domain S-box-containing protein
VNDGSRKGRKPHGDAVGQQGSDCDPFDQGPGGREDGSSLVGLPLDLGEGFLVMNRQGIVVHVSRRFVETTGYPAEELLGRRARQVLFTPGGRRRVRRRLRRSDEEEGRFDVELVRKDGRLLWLEMEIAPLIGADEEAVGTLAAFHDASGRRQAQKALSASEQRLRLLLEQVPAILWTTDRELRFTSSAGSGLATLDLDPGEVVGMSLQEFFGIEDPDFAPIAEHRRAVAGSSTSYDFEWAGVHYSVQLEPLRSRSGGIEGVVGIGIDVSQERATAAALEQSQRRLQAIIDNARELFYSHGRDHRLTYLSPQVRDFLDAEPEEALRRWTDFLTDHPCNQQGVESTQRALETGQRQPPYEMELEGLKGRRIWVEVNETPLLEGGEVVALVGALADVTWQKSLEAKLAAALEREEQLAGLAADIAERAEALSKSLIEGSRGRHDLDSLRSEASELGEQARELLARLAPRAR